MQHTHCNHGDDKSFNKEIFMTLRLYGIRFHASLVIVLVAQRIYHLINHTLFFIGLVLLRFLFIDVFALCHFEVLYEQRLS